MLSIAEASVLGANDIRDGVVEMFVEESAVLQYLGFLPIEGNAYQYNRELTLPSASVRAVNATWSESTGTFQPKTEALKIYGGEAHVDRFIQQTMPANVGDHLAAQLNLKVKAVTYKVHEDLINGDVASQANGIDGLKKRVTAVGGAQVISANPTGTFTIGTDTNTRNQFLDFLDQLIESVRGGADALLMNAAMRRTIRGVARREGFWERDRNAFGQVVETFNGVPLVDVGSNAAGTAIIPSNEPNGAGSPVNETTSIYAVSFKDDALVGLTNGGIQAYEIGGGIGQEMETKPAYGIRIEWYLGLADHTDKSIARLRFLKA